MLRVTRAALASVAAIVLLSVCFEQSNLQNEVVSSGYLGDRRLTQIAPAQHSFPAADEFVHKDLNADSTDGTKKDPTNHFEGGSKHVDVEGKELLNQKMASAERCRTRNLDAIKGAAAVDRDLDGVIVDLNYKLKVPIDWWDDVNVSPDYDKLMVAMHGKNIWDDPLLPGHVEALGLSDPREKNGGSPLDRDVLIDLLETVKPHIFLEVGVFHGMTSTLVARYFKTHDGFKKSYVISMDSWLLDLRFAWSGAKSVNRGKVKNDRYFVNNKDIGGGAAMYYHFLSNCIRSNTTDRIIPMQSATQNGAMALLSHGVRPDMMYIDASHSLPDIFIDLENFWKILKPGGVMAVDDIKIPSVSAALEALITRYDLEVTQKGRNAYFFKN